MAEEEAKPEATPKPAAKPEAAPPPAPKAPPTMAATPWEGDLPREVKDQFGDQILEASSYLGQDFFLVQSGAVIPLLEYLKLDADFDYLVDITAVHYPGRDKQFELFYILYSFARNTRVRIKTRIAETESPQTAVGVHLTANWLEREVFDMFGIRFAGHPNMQRLLLPEDWQGHPLRKDYGIIQMDNQWVKENLGIESGQ